jgi:putative ABC transport system ATP-binding protein
VEDEADAAYLCIQGSAGLYWSAEDGEKRLVSTITPGRLIGDLSVILNERRTLDLIASEDSLFLRIGASELMAVIENDAMVACNIMRTVAGHLSGTVGTLRDMRIYSMKRGVDFSEFDVK